MIPLNFLQHLHLAQIYHNKLNKQKAKQQAQIVDKPREGPHQMISRTVQKNYPNLKKSLEVATVKNKPTRRNNKDRDSSKYPAKPHKHPYGKTKKQYYLNHW